jgi:hypothetical protein
MVGRLLSLGLIETEKFSLTKESLELVDKEFTQVIFSKQLNKKFSFRFK